MDTLWVAEKKTLAEAVANVLPGTPEFAWDRRDITYNRVGDQWFVWLGGHAYEQATPDHYLPESVPTTASGRKVWRKADLPVIPQQWVLLEKQGKSATLRKAAELLKKCSTVVHLGDPDEEGQLLVDEALTSLGFRGRAKRVLVNDYTAAEVRQAVERMRDNDEPLFRGWHQWALARSRYDWLLGLNGTRAMTLRGRELGFDGLLPVGSVQTPLLYIVRERDRTIESFKPSPFYLMVGHIKHAAGAFRAGWKPKEGQRGLDEAGRLIDAQVATDLAARLTGKPASIVKYSKVKKEQKPPLPLSLGELQVEGINRYGYTAQEVLDAAQRLYEVYKVSTYARSDNRYLSEAQHAGASKVLEAVFRLRPDLAPLATSLDVSRKSEAFDDKKMAGKAHHGIVPTVPDGSVDTSAWSERERNVFDLIVRAYLAQFAARYEYLETAIEIEIAGEQFVATGKTPVRPGWKAVFAEPEEGREPEAGAKDVAADSKQTLPAMAQGDSATCERCEAVARKTTPPRRFDEASLLAAMQNVHKYVTDPVARQRLKEGDGIGTPATQAAIIHDMRERQLLVPVKSGAAALMSSAVARTLIDALPMDVKDPAQAGVFKAKLDRVARGELGYEAFMADTEDWVRSIVCSAESLQMVLPRAEGAIACPKCKAGQLRRRSGEKPFWFCSNWNAEPEKCPARFQDAAGKPVLSSAVCPSCKTGELRRRDGSRGAYWFCSNWNREPNKCEAKFDDKAGKPDTAPKPAYVCPKCKAGNLRALTGANGKFWGCNRYKEGCKATFPNKAGKPDMAAAARRA